ncbi:hypothetical protein S1OALGB6SA_2337 [Olavius algarvensis spirochete endosymbiont]|nr:hypothetical protein S1OALGB6SA_2337 [Olavius algarvensis spirochete endosymbiont]
MVELDNSENFVLDALSILFVGCSLQKIVQALRKNKEFSLGGR